MQNKRTYYQGTSYYKHGGLSISNLFSRGVYSIAMNDKNNPEIVTMYSYTITSGKEREKDIVIKAYNDLKNDILSSVDASYIVNKENEAGIKIPGQEISVTLQFFNYNKWYSLSLIFE